MPVRLWLRCLILLVAANMVFLGIRFADNLVSKDVVRAALRDGFEHHALSIDENPANIMTGRDQYSDCIAAELAVLGGRDAIHDAIAPRLLSIEQVTPDLRFRADHDLICLELKQYVNGRYRPVPESTYTRFWQGGASVLAAALMVLPVDGYRALLLDLTLGLIALTAVLAALADRKLLLALAPILLCSFAFGGQFGFSQLFSHGPSQIALWSAAAAMIAWRDRMTPHRLIQMAVLSGAVEAFLDQIISVPLVAGVFLIVAGLVSQQNGTLPAARREAGRIVALGTAWVFGFAGSYLIKLAISMMLLGTAPLTDFLDQLAYRTGTAEPQFGFNVAHEASRLSVLGDNLILLVSNLWRLGYTYDKGNVPVSVFAMAAGLIGWLVALAFLATRSADARDRVLAAGMPYLGAASFLLVWVIALPEHTLCHATFMVRSTIVWLIGGWGWLCAARAAFGPDGRPPMRRHVYRARR